MRGDAAAVAALAAAFAVEGRLVGQQHDIFTSRSRGHFDAILHDRDHLAFALRGGIAGELGRAFTFGNSEPDLAVRSLTAALPRGTSRLALARHRSVEPFTINRDTLAAQRIFGEVVGEAVGVVELECDLAVELIALAQRAGRLVEQTQALLQRFAEARLFAFERFFDQRLAAPEFGIGLAHFADQCRDEAVHEWRFSAQKMRMAHGAPHDPPQDVAAPFVRGEDAVRDEEAGRAQVIGNHAVAGDRMVGRIGVKLGFGGFD